MAESTLSLEFADLKLEVGAFLGYGSTAGNWTANQLAEIERYVQAGVRRFYYPPAVESVESDYEWSFLRPTTTIDTVADDSEQDLPDDFGRIVGDFYYSPDDHYSSIPVVSVGRILQARQVNDDTARPLLAAVRAKTSDGTDGQRSEVMWEPTPDAAYTLSYQYEAYQGKLTDAKPYPLGGMKHGELILESCLSVAEERAEDGRGVHWENFQRLLIAAVNRDRNHGAQYFGPMGNPDALHMGQHERPRHGMTGGTYPITYKGDTW